jgi:outer membrane biosynthesis protein TonB
MVEVHMQEVFIVIPKSTTQPSQANQATATKPSTASPEEHPPAHPTETPHPPEPHSPLIDILPARTPVGGLPPGAPT